MVRLALAALAFGLAACDNDGYQCPPGDEGCTCRSDAECLVDLRCVNGRCFNVPEVKRVFVTSLVFPGAFGGAEAADGECDYLARTAKVGGTWTAWLSTPDQSAADRITGAGPWYLMDHRTLAFETRAQLREGPLGVLSKDEYDANVPIDGAMVWTGTTSTGDSSGASCEGWTSTEGAGTAGSLEGPDAWTDSRVTSPCSDGNRFYCFER